MNANRKLAIFSASVILIFIILDQILKIWVKTNMELGEHIHLIGSWFQLYFIENEGMAFGMSLGAKFGKFLLSFVRIIVVEHIYNFSKHKGGVVKNDAVK